MNSGSMKRTLGLGYRDRCDAGAALGKELLKRRDWNDPVVLALPRGGVPVAAEVARLLDAPLDILVVRKIGHPQHEEFAIGAIAGGGTIVMNSQSSGFLGDVPQADVDRVIEREQSELQRRERLYRSDHPAVPVQGREVIIVDDGLATGNHAGGCAGDPAAAAAPRDGGGPDRGARELRRSRGGGGRGGVRSHA